MPKIRVTTTPRDEIEVSDAEFTTLTRLGLVLETRATTDEGAEKAAEKATAPNPKGDAR